MSRRSSCCKGKVVLPLHRHALSPGESTVQLSFRARVHKVLTPCEELGRKPIQNKFLRRVETSCVSVIPSHSPAMSTAGTWAEAKEEELRMGSRDKRVGWYAPTLDNVSAVQRDLLEKYSSIPPDRVIPHILEVVRVFLS